MNKKIFAGNTPYLSSPESERAIRLDFIIALIPAIIWGIFAFGARAGIIIFLSVVLCNIFTIWAESILERKSTLSTLAPTYTGLLISLTLPASTAYYIPLISSALAVALSQLFYKKRRRLLCTVGITRVLLQAVFFAEMSAMPLPFAELSPMISSFDFSDTSLFAQKSVILSALDGIELSGVGDLFIGSRCGNLGTVSPLMLIIGGIYLLYRKRIKPHGIAVAAVLIAFAGYYFSTLISPLTSIAVALLGGDLFFILIFAANEPRCAPMTDNGSYFFGLAFALLSFLAVYCLKIENGGYIALTLSAAAVYLLEEKNII